MLELTLKTLVKNNAETKDGQKEVNATSTK